MSGTKEQPRPYHECLYRACHLGEKRTLHFHCHICEFAALKKASITKHIFSTHGVELPLPTTSTATTTEQDKERQEETIAVKGEGRKKKRKKKKKKCQHATEDGVKTTLQENNPTSNISLEGSIYDDEEKAISEDEGPIASIGNADDVFKQGEFHPSDDPCELDNNFLFILDELLLNILETSETQTMSIEDMEEAVHSRTGRNFSDLHDLVYETELGSQGVEDFIDNDSESLKIVNLVEVRAKCVTLPHKSSNHYTELDLSDDHFLSCLQYINRCARTTTNATLAIFAKSTFDDSAGIESWPFGVLDLLCWFCPSICHVDMIGCKTLVSSKNKIAVHPRIQIRDLDLLSPSFLINCNDTAKHIQKRLDEKSISPFTNHEGWSLLHSVILLGEIQLVKQLLANNDHGFIESSILQTSLELAITLHHCEIVELLKNEGTISIDPMRLVQLCFLCTHDDDNDEVYDHPLKKVTSNADVMQAIRNRHNTQNCDLKALLHSFCKDSDIDFNLKVFEELFRKVHTSTRSDGVFCCNEINICDSVQMLMKVTERSPNGKIAGFPYLVFSIPNIPLAKFLIREGAYVDKRDNSGCTALFHAVEKAITSPSVQNRLFLKFLLEEKANPNFKNSKGETPLSYSLALISRPCELFQRAVGYTPREDNVLDIWRLLLNEGAMTKIKDDNDRSPVHLLVNLSHKMPTMVCEGVELLHRNGCAINARDANGNTPLHLWAGSVPSKEALGDKQFEEVGSKIVSVRGVAINARNDNEETPLHLAQSWKQVEILIERGALSNAQDLNGDTPLHRFTDKGSLIGEKMKKHLWKKCLTWGMNPWCVNSNGICPFEILLGKSFFESLLHLLKAVCEPDANGKVAESARCFKDPEGNSLLHKACIINSSKVMKICECLLQNGWNVNAKNDSGQTPLFLICSQVGSMELPSIQDRITLLRKYNADPSIADVDGNTCQSLLHESELLQEALQAEVEIPPKINWIRQSENHELLLFDVVHGKKSQIVEGFHHHVNHIGNGSFSVVFPGVDEKDGREVALKRLEKARLKDTQFKRETECLLKLSDCPNVINYVTYVSDFNFVYIVTELMEGTLDAYLDLPQASNNTAKICFDISSGIKHLHDNDVFHRDLKPQNILYKTKPILTIKIADFGLSKIFDEAKNEHSSSGQVTLVRAGTRCWKAPELLKNKPKKYSKGSDIFSCGLLFHYILAKKKHPFDCNEPTAQTDTQTTEENIRRNKLEFCPSLTLEAVHLLTNMLSVRPPKRPNASSLQSFPFFWDDPKRRDFLIAIGNQNVFEEPQGTTGVEKHLKAVYEEKWKERSWDSYIRNIYDDVTSTNKARKNYDTKSTVQLVRFIRNSYTHIHDFSWHTQQLLEGFEFFKWFPCLVTEVYKAVEASDEWKTKDDLSRFFQ